MTPDPYIVSPEAELDEVVSTMAAKKYGSAVVSDNGKVVGIFTTVDACSAFAELLTTRLDTLRYGEQQQRPRLLGAAVSFCDPVAYRCKPGGPIVFTSEYVAPFVLAHRAHDDSRLAVLDDARPLNAEALTRVVADTLFIEVPTRCQRQPDWLVLSDGARTTWT